MVRVELGGVPETLLWTLHHRALEAARPDTVLDDPLAVTVRDRIDYPFTERFGAGRGGLAQWQALRAGTFDAEVRRFMAAHPGGTVVALGEGLETQFWRVDDGRVRWVGVDLAETVAVREELLGRDATGRRALVAASAFDVDAWAGAVAPGGPVLLTAQGLLMYFSRDEVHGLIAALAARFPGASLVFDAIPAWLAARRPPASPGGFVPPPWQWGFDGAEQAALRGLPRVAALRALPVRRGRGVVQGALLPALARVPAARLRMVSIWRAAFA
ncbi:class I SAM-dependent methyltransferase [Conexibacter woesei]|uniref:class I SAM-dependent methyltransferase n=1 Tax=Conexibacter woesei TaxID=191495 RepID=UPI00041766AF|nr:class I SAM-dependent methyltransferase [Conexibacter woesei]